MERKRLAWVDAAKGIGIFLVVWGHFYASEPIKIIIYGFHMPLFFFLSGYVFRLKEGSMWLMIKKKSRQLILPFFVFQMATFLILFLLPIKSSLSVEEFLYLNGEVGFNSPLWFLVVLFEVEIVFFAFQKYMMNQKVYIFFLLLSLVIISSFYQGIHRPFGIHVVPVGVLFYWLGHVVRRQSWLEKGRIISCTSFLIAILVYLTTIFYGNEKQLVGLRSMNIGSFFPFLLASVAGIFLICIIAIRVQPITGLTNFGRNSLFILGTHYFFLIIYSNLIQIVTGEPAHSSYPVYLSLGLTIITFVAYTSIFKITQKLGVAHYFFIK
ncbi:acyltransferase family protein [Listeria booriae]|uniref:acyltransferase family protein n=1 Tax=Listeria booriae TaxID=1552123 RepID=UPI0016277769|nr:acyltransferase family protein [Listeria booriae]MBC2316490.1 acyltransferase family protein [Listeria booriae]MDT0111360.1 acyltransferase family protein [Listeria booriae]